MTTRLQRELLKLSTKKAHRDQKDRIEHASATLDKAVLSTARKGVGIYALNAYRDLMRIYQAVAGKPWDQLLPEAQPSMPAHPLDDLTEESRLDHYASDGKGGFHLARVAEWLMFSVSGKRMERGEAEAMIADIKARALAD